MKNKTEIHEGDKIRFKIATVTYVYSDGSLRVNYGGRGDVDGWTHDVEEIIPASRPLAVGDWVRHDNYDYEVQIVAIHQNYGWLKVGNDLITAALDRLKRTGKLYSYAEKRW